MTFIDQLIANTIRPDVRAISSYHVADASGYVKLDAMENPYQLPHALRAELGQRLADAVLNRYPVPSYASLKAAICARLGVPSGFDVILGNGSDELISMLIMAVTNGADPCVVLSPVPSFVMYERSTQNAGARFVGVPVRDDCTVNLPAMLDAIREHKPKLVFLSYPNNPTGHLMPAADIEAIIAAVGAHGIVVVDEAYEPFAQASFMGRLPEFANVVVMRTLSKLGLAGIRLGYMSAAPALLAEVDKVRPPYNVNVLTQIAAEFALEHIDVLNAQAAAINAERTLMTAALSALPGVHVFPSKANFLLVRVPDSDNACAKLLAHKVLVKNLGKMHPVLANCLRVTVSSPEENSAFLNALKASLA
jgi:histidinol-phosphate aminotransferase